jgi:transcriptional regulator with XRE-family HTH domain
MRTGELRRRRFELMAAEHVKRLGERIAARREALGLTQEEIARAMPGKVSGARISLWDRGEHRPRDDSLEHLAAALQTTTTALLMDAPDTTVTPDPFPLTLEDRIDQAEQRLTSLVEKQNELLIRQSAILERIEAAIDREDAAAKKREADEDAWVERVTSRTREALASDARSPGSTRRTRAKSGSPRG